MKKSFQIFNISAGKSWPAFKPRKMFDLVWVFLRKFAFSGKRSIEFVSLLFFFSHAQPTIFHCSKKCSNKLKCFFFIGHRRASQERETIALERQEQER